MRILCFVSEFSPISGRKRILIEIQFQTASALHVVRRGGVLYNLATIEGMLEAVKIEREIHPFQLIEFLGCVARLLGDRSNARKLYDLLVHSFFAFPLTC